MSLQNPDGLEDPRAPKSRLLCRLHERHRAGLDAMAAVDLRPQVAIPNVQRSFTFGTPVDAWAVPAESFSWRLTNEVNAFGDSIDKLVVWANIFDSVDREQQTELLSEFVNPLAIYALSVPYALQTLFGHTAKYLCSQANLLQKGDDYSIPQYSFDLSQTPIPDHFPSFSKQWEATENWVSARPLRDQGENINPKASAESPLVESYRKMFVHAIAPYLGQGVLETASLTGTPASWTVTVHQQHPLSLRAIVDSLVPKHDAAVKCHSALTSLIAEQWGALSKLLPMDG